MRWPKSKANKVKQEKTAAYQAILLDGFCNNSIIPETQKTPVMISITKTKIKKIFKYLTTKVLAKCDCNQVIVPFQSVNFSKLEYKKVIANKSKIKIGAALVNITNFFYESIGLILWINQLKSSDCFRCVQCDKWRHQVLCKYP